MIPTHPTSRRLFYTATIPAKFLFIHFAWLVTTAVGAILMAGPADARVTTSIGVHVGGPSIHIGARHGHHGYSGHHHTGGIRWSGPRLGIGLHVPLLPIGFGTYWYNDSPYYAYRDNYYVADGRGFLVVEQPRQDPVFSASGPAPVVAAPPSQSSPTPSYEPSAKTGQLYAYPQKGQTDSAATFDRIECETWGGKQTGYFPGQSADNAAKKSDYQRAVVACLEGRGYSVR